MNWNHESGATAPEKETANANAMIGEKLRDALTPGYQAEFDPDEATRAGAFAEDALSEQDAAESGIDLLDAEASDDALVQGRQGQPVAPSDDA